MNKKSVELAMNTIVVAMIVIIVALIIIFVFNKYYGKEAGIIGEQIEKLEGDTDRDGDGILNIFDKCPDDPNPDCKGVSEKEK